MKNTITISIIIAISIISFWFIYFKLEARQKPVNQWNIQSYHYILTLKDEDWVEIRHADGTIVGMVRCDTTTDIGKLFYKDNE